MNLLLIIVAIVIAYRKGRKDEKEKMVKDLMYREFENLKQERKDVTR